MLVRTVPGNRCVAGLSVLDGHLYVVRAQSAHVDLFDAGRSLQLVGQLSVHGLRQPTDIAASQTASVVYVADAVGCVFVVDPSGKVHSRLQVEAVASLPALGLWPPPPVERGPSLESIYRVSFTVVLCEGNKIPVITHTHPFNGPFSGTTRVGRYQKGKTSLDLLK